MKLLIAITKKDIRNGERNDPQCCPVALAAVRSLPERLSRKASWNPIEVTRGCLWFGYRNFFLPQEAKDFVARFDNKRKVEPFSFEINV